MGRLPAAHKRADMTAEELGRQTRNALGLLWRGMAPGKALGARIAFPGVAWWSAVKKACKADAQGLWSPFDLGDGETALPGGTLETKKGGGE